MIKVLHMKNKLPLVSVVMPIHNAERFVGEAIQSIINQTYPNWELIAVNDASTDGTKKILEAFKARYPKKVRVIHLKQAHGKEGDPATNIGIKKAKGSYIAKMDADDIAAPKRIERQVQYLQKNPEVFMVGSSAYVIDAKGKIMGDKIMPTNHQDIYKEYINFHPMIHPTVMFRNIYPKTEDTYRTKYSSSNDYYTFFSWICEGKIFHNLPEKLLMYRIYGENSSFKSIKKKFKNTMGIKMEILQTHGYKLNVKTIIHNIFQIAAVMILPEKVSYYLYLFTKGILKPEEFMPSFKQRTSVAYAHARRILIVATIAALNKLL